LDSEPPEPGLRWSVIIFLVFILLYSLLNVSTALEKTPELPVPAVEYSHAFLLILLAVFLALSAFFSGSETAIFSLDHIRMSHILQKHPKGHGYISKLLDKPQKTLTSILFLNRFVNIGATLSAGALAGSYIQGSPVLSFLIGALTVTFLILILGEIMPKTLAIERTEAFALFSAPILIFFINIITPLRIVLDFLNKMLFRLLKFSPSDKSLTSSEEDLKMMFLSGEVDGILEEDEREMIDGVYEFGEKFVEEIITPRTDVEAFPDTLTQEELISAIQKGHHSRVIIYKEDIDHVIGVLHIKDLLLNPNRRYIELIRPPYVVPPKKELTTLLKEMQKSRYHLAIVVDEFGGMSGIVSLNDLLEEIVGEIKDVREAAREYKDIIRIGQNHYNISGKIEVSELNEDLDLELDEEVARTMAGLALNTLGKIPAESEEFIISGWNFRITSMDGNRIDRIIMKKITSSEKNIKQKKEKTK
jgi:magnesium and cobalt exporter, CNNM family